MCKNPALTINKKTPADSSVTYMPVMVPCSAGAFLMLAAVPVHHMAAVTRSIYGLHVPEAALALTTEGYMKARLIIPATTSIPGLFPCAVSWIWFFKTSQRIISGFKNPALTINKKTPADSSVTETPVTALCIASMSKAARAPWMVTAILTLCGQMLCRTAVIMAPLGYIPVFLV